MRANLSFMLFNLLFSHDSIVQCRSRRRSCPLPPAAAGTAPAATAARSAVCKNGLVSKLQRTPEKLHSFGDLTPSVVSTVRVWDLFRSKQFLCSGEGGGLGGGILLPLARKYEVCFFACFMAGGTALAAIQYRQGGVDSSRNSQKNIHETSSASDGVTVYFNRLI